MKHSNNHYLAKSRQVLEISDKDKLWKLLAEQRAELQKLSLGFGRKRMTPLQGKANIKDKKAIKNVRRSIARILTRLSQLKQQENK